jgi:hypothetical protein
MEREMNTLGIIVGVLLIVLAMQPEYAGEWVAEFQKGAGKTCETQEQYNRNPFAQ